MITVYKGADFLSCNERGDVYSVMVVNGKKIAYVGFNTPICYDDPKVKVVDLDGYTVIPLVSDEHELLLDSQRASCKVLAEGENADFAVLDKNILKDKDAKIIATFINGKKKL